MGRHREETRVEEVKAHITGTVWKIEKKAGDAVNEGDVLVILESMKMEMPIEAPCAGKVGKVLVSEAQPVNEGDVVVVIE
jgi:acetyl-CoA carboxylase biotin carboxyl carrier protein